MTIYLVKIPLHVFDENNEPADEATRYVVGQIDAVDADEAAAIFASRLFAHVLEDDDETPAVLS